MQAIVDGLVGEAVDGLVDAGVGSSPGDGDAQKTGARPTPKPPAKSRTSKTQDSPSEKGSSGFIGPDIGVRT